jgi:hypothetical protein
LFVKALSGMPGYIFMTRGDVNRRDFRIAALICFGRFLDATSCISEIDRIRTFKV